MIQEIIPKDSRYIPLTQQRYCCVPTCIQIIMLKYNIPLIPAELLGYHLGLIVPKDDLHNFWNGRKGRKPKAGYGTQIGEKQYSPNKAFAKLKLPLRMKFNLIDKFKSVEDFTRHLKELEINDKDALLCFDWGVAVGNEFHEGHVCILDRVFLDKNVVRLIDPDKGAKWKEFSIQKMYDAMNYHGKEKMAGVWELNYDK